MAKRKTKKIKKEDLTNRNIAILLGSISLLLLSYLTYGIPLVAVTAFLIITILIVIASFKRINDKKKKKALVNLILIFFLVLGIGLITAFTAFLIYIKAVADPLFEKTNLNTKEMTILYDKDGNQFAKLGSEKREKVKYEQIPEVLVDAIVATEDSRYFQHNGFDAARFMKASLGQVLGNSNAGGASTLSMQVVKNSFTDADAASGISGIIRKFEDIYLSVFKLEKNYSKEEIMEFYVNNHFLGGNIYGVEEASMNYFGKDVSQLNLAEASLLAGMFKSPNYYRPNVNPKNATARRETVLKLMLKHGYINKDEYEQAKSIPVESLVDSVEQVENKYQGYIDTVVSEVKEKYNVNAYTTSLKIYTTLDRKKQDAVERVFNNESAYYQFPDEELQAGVTVLDTQTGAIEAVGAGRHRTGMNSFNFATQINRQCGSTAKPLFDYGPLIEYNNASTYGYNDNGQYKKILDGPYTYSNGRKISNWDNGYKGQMTIRKALSLSRNIPALKAFQMVDNKKIIDFVETLGITPEIENGHIHEAHSIGAFTGVSPLQMTAAYAAFGNGGYYNEPYSVEKIVFRSTGKEKEHKAKKEKAMSDSTAFMITSILQDVQLNGSIGGNINGIARKTGTTNYDDNTVRQHGLAADAIRDSWVIGYSSKTAMGMWYGYDRISKEHYLHNLPASIDKDKLYRALVAEGAIESNRTGWKAPSSVVKIGNEYYKKDYKPSKNPEQTEFAKVPKPGNFSASYDSGSNKVTLSWSAVGPGENGDDSYGTWGYNIYQGSTLLGWTASTRYSFQTSSPYGTYKVIATYKNYTEIQSEAAYCKLEKPQEPIEPEEPTEEEIPEE